MNIVYFQVLRKKEKKKTSPSPNFFIVYNSKLLSPSTDMFFSWPKQSFQLKKRKTAVVSHRWVAKLYHAAPFQPQVAHCNVEWGFSQSIVLCLCHSFNSALFLCFSVGSLPLHAILPKLILHGLPPGCNSLSGSITWGPQLWGLILTLISAMQLIRSRKT